MFYFFLLIFYFFEVWVWALSVNVRNISNNCMDSWRSLFICLILVGILLLEINKRYQFCLRIDHVSGHVYTQPNFGQFLWKSLIFDWKIEKFRIIDPNTPHFHWFQRGQIGRLIFQPGLMNCDFSPNTIMPFENAQKWSAQSWYRSMKTNFAGGNVEADNGKETITPVVMLVLDQLIQIEIT